jgi:cytochrome c
MRRAVLGMTLLALAACGSDGSEESEASAGSSAAPPPVSAAPTPGGGQPASFAACKACHAVEPGKHGIGPSLAGVFGKKFGSAAGFAYSDANRSSGVTWDDATLDAYLEAPAKTMPGTKMTYAGMKDPAKRKELIEYLKSLK